MVFHDRIGFDFSRPCSKLEESHSYNKIPPNMNNSAPMPNNDSLSVSYIERVSWQESIDHRGIALYSDYCLFVNHQDVGKGKSFQPDCWKICLGAELQGGGKGGPRKGGGSREAKKPRSRIPGRSREAEKPNSRAKPRSRIPGRSREAEKPNSPPKRRSREWTLAHTSHMSEPASVHTLHMPKRVM